MKATKLLTLIALLPSAAAWAEKTPSPALLVVNKGHRGAAHPSELAIVDPQSGRVVARVPTGIESHEVAASPDGKLAVVSNTGPYSDPGHTLSVIDLRTQKELRRFELGPLPSPHGLAWHDGKVYFTAEGAKLVARFDPAKNLIDWIMGVGQDSIHMLAFSKNRLKVFTANRGSASVAAVSLAMQQGPGRRGQVVIPVEPGPEGIDVTPDGTQVWVGCRGAITIIDAANDQVVSTIQTGGGNINRIKLTPDGKRALATQGNGPLMVFDVASHTQQKRIDTGGSGASLLITPDGTRAYVGMTDKDKVAVVDLTKLEVTGELRTGDGPDGMSWVP